MGPQFGIIVTLLVAVVSTISAQTPPGTVEFGVCVMKGTTNDPLVQGTVYFSRVNSSVVVKANINGITNTGLHGMHIWTYQITVKYSAFLYTSPQM